MTEQRDLPTLGPTTPDRLAALVRSIASAVPVAGGLIAEAVTCYIPNQRIDRVERYLKLLTAKLDELLCAAASDDAPTADQLLRDPNNLDLIEQGVTQAMRALSEERLNYLANCVANGLQADARRKIHHRRLLDIVGELDDEELLILRAYKSHNPEEFDRLRPEQAHFTSSPEAVEAEAMYKAALGKLERVGLLEFKAQLVEIVQGSELGRGRPQKLEVPAMDSQGRPKGRFRITLPGRMVLRATGLVESVEQEP